MAEIRGTIEFFRSLSKEDRKAYKSFAEAGGVDLTSKQTIKQSIKQNIETTSPSIIDSLVRLWAGDKGQDAGQPVKAPLAGFGDAVTVTLVSEAGNLGAMRDGLAAAGIDEAGRTGRVVDVRINVDDLPKLLSVPGILQATPSAAERHAGSVESQASKSMGTDAFNVTFRVDGSGQTVGILSDSFDVGADETIALGTRYADDIASGDLPAGILILDDSAGDGDNTPTATNSGLFDEGRAMAQLIHDVAPGAELAFHTAFTGRAEFAQGILDLAAAGSTVIVDDIGYSTSPVYLDGVIAQAANAVAAQDIPYFSSAGNSANNAYEGPYDSVDLSTVTAGDIGGDAADAAILADIQARSVGYGTAHDFDPSGAIDISQNVTTSGPGFLQFFMQWDDLFPDAFAGSPGAATDLDLLVYSDNGSYVFGFESNNIGAAPVQGFGVGNSGGPVNFRIVLANALGPDPERFVWREFGSNFSLADGNIVEHAKPAGTSYGQASAEGALGIGASFYGNTPGFGADPALLNGFSSAGGVPILYEIDTVNGTATDLAPGDPARDRQRVDLVATDGTDTTFFFPGSDPDSTGFPNFFGTSAAAPHAAAVTALLKQIVTDATVPEIQDALRLSAFGMDDPFTPGDQSVQVDDATGHGFINPEGALRLLTNVIDGSGARDDLAGTAGQDVMLGLEGNDILRGRDGKDRLIGEEGRDRLYGDHGDDHLFGGDGNDLLRGGSGADVLEGEGGANILVGGTGADTFVIRSQARDRIGDFENDIDTLVIGSDLGSSSLTLDDIIGGVNVSVAGNIVAQVAGMDVASLLDDLIIEDGGPALAFV